MSRLTPPLLVVVVVLIFGVLCGCCCCYGKRSIPEGYHTWIILVKDTQQAGPPDAEDFRHSIEKSGMNFIKQMTSTKYSVSLWIMEGTDVHWKSWNDHSLSPHVSSRYSITASSKGRFKVKTKKVRAASEVKTSPSGNWGTDRIDQQALPLDGNYNPGATGAGANIYIVDTGVGYNSDLAGRVIQEYTVFSDEQAYDDENGHGTHVAGLAAGTIYGVAKQATIHSYRVLDSTGSGTLSDLASGLFAVLNNFVPPAVVNLSIEYVESDSTINAIIAHLIAAKVTVVAAAGNSGSTTCSQPAAVSGVISVGASTINDNVAYYSDYGSCVDFFAPGDNLLSDWINNSTQALSGTSMACAMATGSAALLLGNYPSSTPAQVGNGIMASATVGALSNGSPNRMLYVVGMRPVNSGNSVPRSSSASSSSSAKLNINLWTRSIVLPLLLLMMFCAK